MSDHFGKVDALSRGNERLKARIGFHEFLQQVVREENSELASFQRKSSGRNYERFLNYRLPKIEEIRGKI